MNPADDAWEEFTKAVQEVLDDLEKLWHEFSIEAAQQGYDLVIDGEFERWLEGDRYGLWS